MPDATPSFAELDALTSDQLREQAFDMAQHRHDLGFFWDLIKHLHASSEFVSDDGSAGGLGESIGGLIDLANELLGRHDGELEPLLRARYISYLQS